MDDQKRIRTDLLEYCKMDTFAMYKILKFLRNYYIIMDVFANFRNSISLFISLVDC